MTWKRVFTAAAIVGLVAAAAHAQSTDVMVGTWKLNPGKSTTTFRSATTVVEAAGRGIKTTVDLVAGDGPRTTSRGRRSTTAGTIRSGASAPTNRGCT